MQARTPRNRMEPIANETIMLSVMKLHQPLWMVRTRDRSALGRRGPAHLLQSQDATALPLQRGTRHNGPMRSQPPTPRRLTCARCGKAFDCHLGGGCWCAAEPYRLPMPDEAAEDCLCPACLRAAAARAKAG